MKTSVTYYLKNGTFYSAVTGVDGKINVFELDLTSKSWSTIRPETQMLVLAKGIKVSAVMVQRALDAAIQAKPVHVFNFS
ncbi:hypothetical protein SEA_SIXAMA_28 [Gordonia phage Sixama]|uniref:Uncharacterized protein n=1 Tax=Gordonia phage Sixama TaxID=2653271 RepID=A0A5Q2F3Z0_9CAUD|nr:hypothetical protein PP302_gp028 [Gordonia phage Sixama]QGF20207.1 hypothetical protein SEA_SIXAMA_28 [Gordonia phage Sixama]